MNDITFQNGNNVITFQQVNSSVVFKVGYGSLSDASSFTDLNDTPADYVGQQGKLIKVNATEDGLIYGDPSGASVSWGDIAGSLPNQTDLQNELDGKEDADPAIQNHLTNFNNPHNVDKSDVGLASVDNTSDADKPISDDTAAALAGKEDSIGPKGTAFNKNFGTLGTEVMPGDTTFNYDDVNAAPITHVGDPTHLTSDERDAMTAAAPTGADPLTTEADLSAHTTDTDIHVTTQQSAALDNANGPSGANPVATVADLGTGSGHVIQNPAGTPMPDEPNLQFTGDVIVSDDPGNNRTVVNVTAGAGSGEANTASNVGTGSGVWLNKVGVNLNFRSLLSANGAMAIVESGNEVLFTVQLAGTGAAATVARSDHDHNLTYLGIGAKAADSELLDGQDSTAFALSADYNAHIANQQHVPNGGTATQVLGKASATDLDTTWLDAIQEAAVDNTIYSRQNGAWVPTPLSPVGALFLNYNWSNNILATDPGLGIIKCNDIDPAAASAVYIDQFTAASNDASNVIESYLIGDYMGVWETGSDHAGIYYRVTGAITNNGGWYTIPVTVIPGSSGTLDDGAGVVAFQIVNENNKLPAGGDDGALLVKTGTDDYKSTWIDPGISFGSSWLFDSSTAINPSVGDFRLNQATQAATTEIYISAESASGIDLSAYLNAVPVGEKFVCYDNQDHTRAALYTINAPVVDNGTWFLLPVTFEDQGTGEFRNNKITSFQFFGLGGSGAITFLELLDTPADYAGQAGKSVVVNGTEDGLEFLTVGGGAGTNLSNTPTINDVTIESDTGNNTAIVGAGAGQAGVMTAAQYNDFVAKENGLGNPSSDGDVLTSTVAGVRSWASPGTPDLTDAEFPSYNVSVPVSDYAASNPAVNFALSNKIRITAASVGQITLAGVASRRATTIIEVTNSNTITGIVSAGNVEWGDDGPPTWAGKALIACYTPDGSNFVLNALVGVA